MQSEDSLLRSGVDSLDSDGLGRTLDWLCWWFGMLEDSGVSVTLWSNVSR